MVYFMFTVLFMMIIFLNHHSLNLVMIYKKKILLCYSSINRRGNINHVISNSKVSMALTNLHFDMF